MLTFLICAVALNEHLDALSLQIPSPSEVITSASTLAQVFGGEHALIHIGQPGGAPAVIFNPILAALQQKLDHLEQIQVSVSDINHAAQYIRSVVKFHGSEEEFQNNIKESVTNAIGSTGIWERCITLKPGSKAKGTKFILNASWFHDMLPILILELKNLSGVGGDALFQAVLGYSKIVLRDEVHRSMSHLCCFKPCAYLCL